MDVYDKLFLGNPTGSDRLRIPLDHKTPLGMSKPYVAHLKHVPRANNLSRPITTGFWASHGPLLYHSYISRPKSPQYNRGSTKNILSCWQHHVRVATSKGYRYNLTFYPSMSIWMLDVSDLWEYVKSGGLIMRVLHITYVETKCDLGVHLYLPGK